MKLRREANGRSKLVMSKKEWENIGKEAGWGDTLKNIIGDPLKKVFEPERTNPYPSKKDEEDTGSINLTKDFSEQQILQTPWNKINIDEVESKLNNALFASDGQLLVAIPKACEFVRNPPKHVTDKTINGMKIVLYRIANLPPGKSLEQNKAILKKWHQQKIESEKMWEKPKNPYL